MNTKLQEFPRAHARGLIEAPRFEIVATCSTKFPRAHARGLIEAVLRDAIRRDYLHFRERTLAASLKHGCTSIEGHSCCISASARSRPH